MKKTFDENFEHAVQFAIGEMKKRGEVDSMFVGFTATGALVFPGTWKNDEEKLSFLNVLRVIFHTEGVTQYIVLHEAWQAKPNPAFSRPSEDPARREILIVMSASRVRRSAVIFEILRNEDGSFKGLGERQEVSGAGQFMELLLPEDFEIDEQIKQEAREIVRAFTKIGAGKTIFH